MKSRNFSILNIADFYSCITVFSNRLHVLRFSCNLLLRSFLKINLHLYYKIVFTQKNDNDILLKKGNKKLNKNILINNFTFIDRMKKMLFRLL